MAVDVGQLQIRGDGGSQRPAPGLRTERPYARALVVEQRHAETIGEHPDVEPPGGAARHRHAAVALAQALGLGRPSGACLELSRVDRQGVKEHALDVISRVSACFPRAGGPAVDAGNSEASSTSVITPAAGERWSKARGTLLADHCRRPVGA